MAPKTPFILHLSGTAGTPNHPAQVLATGGKPSTWLPPGTSYSKQAAQSSIYFTLGSKGRCNARKSNTWSAHNFSLGVWIATILCMCQDTPIPWATFEFRANPIHGAREIGTQSSSYSTFVQDCRRALPSSQVLATGGKPSSRLPLGTS